MTAKTDPPAVSWMAYPKDGLMRALYKLPIYAFRTGTGWMLPGSFVLITTYGNKSGLPRRTMVEAAHIDGAYYLVAAWGEASAWYRNLQANPAITVQPVRGTTLQGKVSWVVSADELRRIVPPFSCSPMWEPWLKSIGIASDVESIVAARDRLHLLRVNPSPDIDAPPPQPRDLMWWWGVVAAVIGVWWLARRQPDTAKVAG